MFSIGSKWGDASACGSSQPDCAHVPARAKGQTDGLKGAMKDVISGVKSMMTEIMSFIAPLNPHLSVPELALALGRGRSPVADELALEFAVSKRASAHPGT